MLGSHLHGSLMYGKSGGQLLNDNSETIYNHCSFQVFFVASSKHPSVPIWLCIKPIEKINTAYLNFNFLNIQCGADLYMLGYKAPF